MLIKGVWRNDRKYVSYFRGVVTVKGGYPILRGRYYDNNRKDSVDVYGLFYVVYSTRRLGNRNGQIIKWGGISE